MVFITDVPYVWMRMGNEGGVTSDGEIFVSTVDSYNEYELVGVVAIDPAQYTNYSQFWCAVANGVNTLQGHANDPVPFAQGDWQLVRIDCHNGVQTPCTVDEGNFQRLYTTVEHRPYRIRAVVYPTDQRIKKKYCTRNFILSGYGTAEPWSYAPPIVCLLIYGLNSMPAY